MEQLLENDQIRDLRQRGIVTESEVAILEGDLVVAKNVLSGERRLLGKLNEIVRTSNKRILKG